MEVYAQPLSRVIYGQNKLLSLNTSQRALYFKYATRINAFLAGITADILRMRLKQAADECFMSLKNFFDCHRINIVLALNHSRNLLNLVYPPNEISPNLAAWNTKLLCIVLRATNCLNVREQDDVIYIAKVNRQYFNRIQLKIENGTITKKGHMAKREWIRTCSAVQRMVEVVDDARLMKELRNFICKVEMEEKTLKARQDTQFRLKSLLSEIVADNSLLKRNEKNLNGEAKQTVKRQLPGVPSKRKQKTVQRPQSAGARLSMGWVHDEKVDFDLKHRESSESRLTSANKSDMSASRKRNTVYTKTCHNVANSSERKGTATEKLNADTSIEDKLFDRKAGARNECIKDANKKKDKVGKRPLSATERNTTRATTCVNNRRPKSASNTPKTVEKTCQGSNVFRVKNTLFQREMSICSRPGSAKDNRPTAQVLKVQWPPKQPESKQRSENGNAALVKNANVSRKVSNNGRPIQREHSKLNLKGSLPTSSRRPISARSNKNLKKRINENSKQTVKETVICVPTAEPDRLENANDTSDSKHIHKKSLKNKKRTKRTEEAHKQTDRKENTALEETAIEKQIDLDNCPTQFYSGENNNSAEEQKVKDKRRLFDDNMKKIANEVLVHQRIHEAAKNPLLQDKEFVDEFFSFLNENHVTKKFLRTQSTEPHQSWKLHNGKHANFSFFVAFVFRHVENKDLNMVSYVVEKMLLRMRCKHSVQEKSGDRESSSAKSGLVDMDKSCVQTGTGNSGLTSENKRRSYKEFSSSMNNGHMFSGERHRKTTRARSASRERSCTAAKPTKRSRSASKSRARPESGEEMPKLYRSTSITDNQCWKCLQKDVALTACVNWSNRCLCDLLIAEGVPYKDEHLSAAVKANDLVTLVKIVYFLRYHGIWDASNREARNALFLAKKHKMLKTVEFLTEEGVQDDRIVNHTACTPCFIA
ncbi:uncharacterized protein LOC123554925 [Mercenaria mercenaria]|uniref:uncharacterized protein LOC123554925 n=1 Tax=Mercenaria mercenaria TaxID=6596 RepID=UPI00234E7A4A|nr:uncharacterized protein LOC123554925 [Mercenaria mercenaria]XP_045201293.2 uncharacterized protein LOC123554925 [Mercenaria mercenaria]